MIKKIKIVYRLLLLIGLLLPTSLMAQNPGGVTSYDLELWLSADQLLGKGVALPEDEVEVTSWKDLSSSGYNFVRNGSDSVPVFSYSGMNFNPSINFTSEWTDNASEKRKLISNTDFSVTRNKSYYIFYASQVDKIDGSNYYTLFSFNYRNDHVGWQTTTDGLTKGWFDVGGFNQTVDGSSEYGILGATYTNSTSVNQTMSFNGVTTSLNGRMMYNYGLNRQAIIGNSGISRTDPFYGDVQEVILYSTVAGKDINPIDLAKIQSYLAIKYGITLVNTDYVTSTGTVVWNNAANTGYNNDIFGIGRDDASTLYVKQSSSQSGGAFTVFVGSDLQDLNINNTGSIDNGTFVMFGSNGLLGTIAYEYDPKAGIPFLSGVITEPVNRMQKAIQKVQLTNSTEFKLSASAGGYILVSTDPTFQPQNTRVYSSDSESIEFVVHDGEYITSVFYGVGPGGVIDDLRMWLDAGKEQTITKSATGEVLRWKDRSNVSGTVYKYKNIYGNMFAPDYVSNSIHTNFYPSVHYGYLGQKGDYSNTKYPQTYLITNRGPSSIQTPKEYTIINLIYAAKIKNNRTYFMSFGSQRPTGDASRHPVFGMMSETKNNTTKVFGRYWENKGITNKDGTVALFDDGSTAINITGINAPQQKLFFESNGTTDVINTTDKLGKGTIMNKKGMLGAGSLRYATFNGYIAQSIYYERELTNAEKEKVYSFLGLKYGVTLNMPTVFNYFLSDNKTSVWDGYNLPFSLYHHNIAGLVRDDGSDLFNNVARSTNAGAFVAMMFQGITPSDGQGQQSLFKKDKQYLIWGNNGKTGIYTYTAQELEQICGEAKMKTNKIWMVNKSPDLDRMPVTMRFIQGQEGDLETFDKDLNGYISPGYQLVLLVADDPQKLIDNNWDLAIPSSYLKNVKSATLDYTFTAEKTYFSIGVKVLPGACETCDFEGEKKVEFTSKTWSPNGTTDKTFNLGINSPVVGDAFDVNVKAYFDATTTKWLTKRYPRASTGKSLKQSRNEDSSPMMITEITPTVPAAVEFQILNVDRQASRYKRIEVYGECVGGTVIPALSYVGKRNSYTIRANVATAKRSPLSGYAANPGKLNVFFDQPVEKIIIKENSPLGKKGSQTIGIGPISFACPAPIPPFSEAGVAFSKQATPEVLLCGTTPVKYNFRVYNANCENKIVNIMDTLPDNMYWDPDLISIDDIAISTGTKIKILEDGKILSIDSLYISGSADPFIFQAQAFFKDEATAGEYENQAWLNTSYIEDDIDVPAYPLPSSDYYRGAGLKSKTIATDGGIRLKPVIVTVTKSNDCYRESNEILIKMTVNNPNPNTITDMFLDMGYSAEFEYIRNSFSSSISSLGNNPQFENDGGTDVPGYFYLEGFMLPSGESTFTFKVKAPIKANLELATDGNGNPIGWDGSVLTPPIKPDEQAIFDFEGDYEFSTDMDDECIYSSLIQANGTIEIPYCRSKAYIISNRNATQKIKK